MGAQQNYDEMHDIDSALDEIKSIVNSIARITNIDYDRNNNYLIKEIVNIDLCNLAELILQSRRKRNEIFSEWNLFGEPAYDMLLDLFIARSKNKLLPVSSVCFVSGVPFTTALRWVKILESHGLVERFQDERDGRRSLTQLSEKGFELMKKHISNIAEKSETIFKLAN